MLRTTIRTLSLLAMTVWSAGALANPITGDTCGDPDRTGTLTGAAECAYADDPGVIDANGTLKDTDLAILYGDTWTDAGELTASGTSGYLTANSDTWGSFPNSGTWSIDASFWTVYDKAIITIHVGGGQYDPDNWAWLMIDNAASGTWSVNWTASCIAECQGGGGLSNIKLWGAGEGDMRMPEPGTLALLGLGLFGMGVVRRRRA